MSELTGGLVVDRRTGPGVFVGVLLAPLRRPGLVHFFSPCFGCGEHLLVIPSLPGAVPCMHTPSGSLVPCCPLLSSGMQCGIQYCDICITIGIV